MMKKSILFVFALMISVALFAQDEAPAPKMGWTQGAGLGLDLAQLLQFNPKVGAGENKIGVGGAVNYFANYKNGRLAWDNLASLALGVQKLGAGVKQVYSLNGTANDVKVPWQKSVDELRINSKAGYATAENSKWFYASDLSFLSQLTPTYSGNFMSDIYETDASPISKLFSPATITWGLGMDYKQSDKLSFYLSPITLKTIIVADDAIANMEAIDGDGIALGKSIHGNPWRSNGDFDNAYVGIGALARVIYATKLWNDKIIWKSNLGLFTDYKNNPFSEIDVDWNNEFGIEIFKGLQLSVLVNVFYDDDVYVQVTDNDAINGINGLGKRASITEQLLLKYVTTF